MRRGPRSAVGGDCRRLSEARVVVRRPLELDGLDEDRLALYLLAQRLSLTAGPLRLLDGDFTDRAFMAGIAEYNLKKALELVHA